ncbi:Protein of unknown function [Gryllus bimaculatus]|nr:Protein of unknown function [Gryllus bimaculatus]
MFRRRVTSRAVRCSKLGRRRLKISYLTRGPAADSRVWVEGDVIVCTRPCEASEGDADSGVWRGKNL